MIHCYFDDNCYYIVGPNTEIYSTIKNPESDPIRRAYWTLLMVIPEFSNERDNVTFYNDSRVIDEMNGIVHTLDDWTREAKRISNSLFTSLYGIMLFRKIDAGKLSQVLSLGRDKLIDPIAKQKLVSSAEEAWQKKHNSRIAKLKSLFFGEKNA